MTALSTTAIDRLREAGIDPQMAAALDDLVETPDANGEFDLVCRRTGWPVSHRWIPAGEPQPWPAGERPAVWWPVGKAGSTAIVVVGAASALWLTSVLFRVGRDGEVYRRPNLPEVLADAVPVCLPETAPSQAAEWTHQHRVALPDASQPEDLFTELVSPELRVIVTAIPKPRPPGPSGNAVDAFIDKFLGVCASCETTPALTLLPAGVTWPEVFASFRGAAQTYALAGALELARHQALGALSLSTTAEGGDPP